MLKPVKTTKTTIKEPQPLMKKPMSPMPTAPNNEITPEFKLFKVPKDAEKPDLLHATVKLPGEIIFYFFHSSMIFSLIIRPCTFLEFFEFHSAISFSGVRSIREITLDLGEDRIILEARKAGFALDVFVPFLIVQDGSSASFHRDKHVLTIEMPLQQ